MFNPMYCPAPAVPIACIAINKSRIKRYETPQPTYYLGDKTEFQLELFNPTKDTLLAKITIDGKNVSQGGLILKPGVRIFLDRPLDVAKKFRFDTYEVENSNEALNAIADNGGVQVNFYKESQVKLIQRPIFFGNTNTIGGYVGRGTTTNVNLHNLTGNHNTTTNYGINTSINPLRGSSTSSTTSFTTQGFNSDFVGNSASMDFMDSETLSDKQSPQKKSRSREMKSLSKNIETGRVGAGSTSNQEFITVDTQFEYNVAYTTSFKILPLSQKLSEVGETLVKRYCASCGFKQKPEFKYCPSCGEKC